MWKQWKQWQTLFFGAPKSLKMVTAAMKLKDVCPWAQRPAGSTHSSTRGLRPPEQLEMPAGFPSSDKTRPDSPVPTLQGPCGRSPPSRPRRGIASPVAIRRGEGAQRKRCRNSRCSPRGNPACRGTFGGHLMQIMAAELS